VKGRLLLALVAACVAVAAPSAVGQVRAAGTASYIVVFKTAAVPVDRVPAAARDLARTHAATISFVYRYALRGFAARMAPGEVRALARDPRVAYVEPDGVVHALGSESPATWVPCPLQSFVPVWSTKLAPMPILPVNSWCVARMPVSRT
jgi:serine protease